MSPGGHLLTSAAAGLAAFAATGSPTFTAGVATGGFLIDLDHVVDYVVFDGERDLRPGVFLRHYIDGHARRAVLLLHSYELFVLLAAIAWQTHLTPLIGYLFGAVLHLTLDLIFNREITPRSIFAFYSFAYRAAHRFDARALLGPVEFEPTRGFWRGFFLGARPTESSATARGPVRAT